MDVLKMRFTPPCTPRSRRSRNDPGSSAAAESLLRICPKRAGSLKSARGSAHGDAQRVCYITALWPTYTLRGLLAVQRPMRSLLLLLLLLLLMLLMLLLLLMLLGLATWRFESPTPMNGD